MRLDEKTRSINIYALCRDFNRIVFPTGGGVKQPNNQTTKLLMQIPRRNKT